MRGSSVSSSFSASEGEEPTGGRTRRSMPGAQEFRRFARHVPHMPCHRAGYGKDSGRAGRAVSVRRAVPRADRPSSAHTAPLSPLPAGREAGQAASLRAEARYPPAAGREGVCPERCAQVRSPARSEAARRQAGRNAMVYSPAFRAERKRRHGPLRPVPRPCSRVRPVLRSCAEGGGRKRKVRIGRLRKGPASAGRVVRVNDGQGSRRNRQWQASCRRVPPGRGACPESVRLKARMVLYQDIHVLIKNISPHLAYGGNYQKSRAITPCCRNMPGDGTVYERERAM